MVGKIMGKVLVPSNSSFLPQCFRKPIFPEFFFKRRIDLILLAKDLISEQGSHHSTEVNTFNPFPNKPWFLRVWSTSLLKTLCEKEKLLVTSNISISHSVFYPFEELPSFFVKFEIVICKLFQFGRV